MTSPPVRLRPATEADDAFLLGVYASTRAAELDLLAWTDDQKLAFVTQQHVAQSTSYRDAHPHGQFLVVELADGRPIGRLYLSRLGQEIRVLDIALLPNWCGHGIGTTLLGDVIAEADCDGVRVSLHVEVWNPAISLYRRLGFRETGRNDVYVLLERSPVDRANVS